MAATVTFAPHSTDEDKVIMTEVWESGDPDCPFVVVDYASALCTELDAYRMMMRGAKDNRVSRWAAMAFGKFGD